MTSSCVTAMPPRYQKMQTLVDRAVGLRDGRRKIRPNLARPSSFLVALLNHVVSCQRVPSAMKERREGREAIDEPASLPMPGGSQVSCLFRNDTVPPYMDIRCNSPGSSYSIYPGLGPQGRSNYKMMRCRC